MSDSRANLFHGKRVTAERRTSIDDWRGSRASAWSVPPPMERRESVTTRSHRVRIASSSLAQSSSRSVPARILFASARNRFDLDLSALIRPIRLSALIRPIRPHSPYPPSFALSALIRAIPVIHRGIPISIEQSRSGRHSWSADSLPPIDLSHVRQNDPWSRFPKVGYARSCHRPWSGAKASQRGGEGARSVGRPLFFVGRTARTSPPGESFRAAASSSTDVARPTSPPHSSEAARPPRALPPNSFSRARPPANFRRKPRPLISEE